MPPESFQIRTVSLADIPAIRAIFDRRFGSERIAAGGELTSIAHGLALIGAEPDPSDWAA